MLRTPLYEIHRSLGANFASFRDWELPEHFGSVEREYSAVRSVIGLYDRSARARLVITGRDRFTWLQGMISNDVRRLEHEQASLQACILDATGHMLADPAIINRGDSLLLDLDWSVRQRTFDTLSQFIIAEDVEIVDQSEFLACISVQGPMAAMAMEDLGVSDSFVVCPADHTGVGGFDIFVRAAEAGNLWQSLISAGATPVGEAAVEILRVGAGIPKYGVDMDESNIPLECGLEATHISYEKGCYVGQEIIARIQSRGHTNRALTGFKILGDRLPSKGERIMSHVDGETRNVGWVTSAVTSPIAGPIALGYLRHEFRQSGMKLRSEHECSIEVTDLPFVPKTA